MTLIDKLNSDKSVICGLANELVKNVERSDVPGQYNFGPQFCTYGASVTFDRINVQAVFWDEVTKKYRFILSGMML